MIMVTGLVLLAIGGLWHGMARDTRLRQQKEYAALVAMVGLALCLGSLFILMARYLP